jgi:tetratricopeptide (TPR) repeat protein
VADGMADKAALCYKEAHRIWKANDNATDAAIASFELVRKLISFLKNMCIFHHCLIITAAPRCIQAALYEEQEQHSLAAKSYHECLELFSSSNDLIPCINYRLGTLHSILKNTREAITHYSNFVGSLRSDGSRDETYLISLRSLAQLFAKDGEYEKSFSIYDELIEFMEITDDPDQDALASIYHEEGSVHFELSNLDDALTSLQTSMKIRKSMGNDEINHDEIGKLLLDLTKVFEVKEDFIAASNSLLEVRCLVLPPLFGTSIETHPVHPPPLFSQRLYSSLN